MSVTSGVPSTMSFDKLSGPDKIRCMEDQSFMTEGKACSKLFLNEAIFRPYNVFAPEWTG
eukprot:5439643-Amphidinium_carterae.1